MQKIILIVTLFILGILASFGQENYTVTVQFEGMESDKGDLYVALYNKKESFLKKAFKGTIVKVVDKKAIVELKELPKGIYAISAFHDENDNKKMDTKIFGIPKEPIGISNDAKGFMGPPKYKDAKFEVTQDTTISITVK